MTVTEYVVMVERSVGNGEVGEMWCETAVFPETATLADVGAWLTERCRPKTVALTNIGQGRVTLQLAQRPVAARKE